MFGADTILDLVGSFADGNAATKKTQTRNFMYIPFQLLPYVLRQNFTPKAVSLGLECRLLHDLFLAAATFTTGNAVPVTLQDKTELGLDPTLRLFAVINNCCPIILHVQLPAL